MGSRSHECMDPSVGWGSKIGSGPSGVRFKAYIAGACSGGGDVGINDVRLMG